jgi:hypothetical protein
MKVSEKVPITAEGPNNENVEILKYPQNYFGQHYYIDKECLVKVPKFNDLTNRIVT